MKKITLILLILLIIAFPVKASDEALIDIVINTVTQSYQDMPKEQQVKACYDYLIDNVEYDYDYNKTSYTSYGALITGKAVCQGYSLALYEMLQHLDITSNVVLGHADGISHSWNTVMLNGFFFIDVTWNDTMNTEKYYMVKNLQNHYFMFFLY